MKQYTITLSINELLHARNMVRMCIGQYVNSGGDIDYADADCLYDLIKVYNALWSVDGRRFNLTTACANDLAAFFSKSDPNGEYAAHEFIEHPEEFMDILERWRRDANEGYPSWYNKCLYQLRLLRQLKLEELDNPDLYYTQH